MPQKWLNIRKKNSFPPVCCCVQHRFLEDSPKPAVLTTAAEMFAGIFYLFCPEKHFCTSLLMERTYVCLYIYMEGGSCHFPLVLVVRESAGGGVFFPSNQLFCHSVTASERMCSPQLKHFLWTGQRLCPDLSDLNRGAAAPRCDWGARWQSGEAWRP